MGHTMLIPYRLKILATLLVLVTAVVSIIAFTMSRLFHEDKKAYVTDLAAVVAVHAAEEADLVLSAHRERLLALARVIDDPAIPVGGKSALLQELFTAMNGCVAVRFYEGGAEVGSLIDSTGANGGLLARTSLAYPLGEHLRDLAAGDGSERILNTTTRPDAPALTLAVLAPRGADRPTLIVAGVLDVDGALALGRSAGAFQVFLVDPSGRVLVHSDRRIMAKAPRLEFVPEVGSGMRVVAREYGPPDEPMIGGFARMEFHGLRAGAQVPKAAAYLASKRLLTTLVTVSLLLLAGIAVVSIAWSSRLTRSLGKLAQAAQEIGRGRFDAQVTVHTRDELGQLAESFNQMAGELRAREQALRNAQAQLIQSEKMAAFGQLGAGIAHEVKNPLAGVLGLVQLTFRSMPDTDPTKATLATIEKETKRCRTIIDNLLRFARPEKVNREPVALATIVADTVALTRHSLSMHGIELRVDVPETLPVIHASGNQIQQVLLNLILNAEQAMDGRGRGLVTITAGSAIDDFVEVRITDDGPGIPKQVVDRIFEPFFTTKPAGKGTGLGLSVSFGIVRDHGGTIRVKSEPGRGATFVVRLPVRPSVEEAAGPDGKADVAPAA
jgi:signal transduction histidine kinase